VCGSEEVKLPHKEKKKQVILLLLLLLLFTISALNSAQAYSEDNSVVNHRVPQGYTSCCSVN
jgi:hypothetical protein